MNTFCHLIKVIFREQAAILGDRVFSSFMVMEIHFNHVSSQTERNDGHRYKMQIFDEAMPPSPQYHCFTMRFSLTIYI